jgi:hypothetical protein
MTILEQGERFRHYFDPTCGDERIGGHKRTSIWLVSSWFRLKIHIDSEKAGLQLGRLTIEVPYAELVAASRVYVPADH